MSTVMEIATREMGFMIAAAQANLRYLPGPVVNVAGYGAVGDGVTDDTSAVQQAIDDAIEKGMKLVFFPHGVYGSYFVTSLNNDDQVIFVGDNAHFVGGYAGIIQQFGAIDFGDMPIDGGNFTDPYLNPIINGGTF